MARTAAATAQAVEVPQVVLGIRHIIRRIGAVTNEAAGVMSALDFEAYLQEAYFADGWDVQHVEVLAQDQGAQYGLDFNPVNMLYVLVKRANNAA